MVLPNPLVRGAKLGIVLEGIPKVILVEMCYLSWKESLVALAKLLNLKYKVIGEFRRLSQLGDLWLVQAYILSRAF